MTSLLSWIEYGDFIEHGAMILYPALLVGLMLAGAAYFFSGTARSAEPASATGRISSAELLLLLGIVGLGAALRTWGLTFGLPANFHPDEIPKLNAIERMRGFGDLNPRYFLHPSLLLYATHFSQQFGSVMGLWDESRQALNIAGRTVSLIAGTLTIPGVWVIGRWLSGRASIGVLAAFLIAVAPLHVTCSRYLKEDALVTLWMVLTAAIVAIVVGAGSEKSIRRRRWWLVLAGLTAGVSASSKYTGLVFGALVVAAPWLASRTIRPDRALLVPVVVAGFAVAIGFLACSPYVLLDWQTFIDDFMYEKRHMRGGHMVVISPWDHWWGYQIGRSLLPGWGLLAGALTLLGVGASFFWTVVERNRLAALVLLGLFLTYIPAELVNAKPEPQPDRYLVVCMPWLALAAALLSVRMLDLLQARKSLNLALTVVLGVIAVAPLVRTIHLGIELRYDTRTEMGAWIEQHLPPGSKIAVDYLWYGPVLKEGQFEVTSLHGGEILERIRIGKLREAGFEYVIVSSFFRDRFFRQRDNLGHLRDLFRRLDRELPVLHRSEAATGPYGFHNPTLVLYSLKK